MLKAEGCIVDLLPGVYKNAIVLVELGKLNFIRG